MEISWRLMPSLSAAQSIFNRLAEHVCQHVGAIADPGGGGALEVEQSGSGSLYSWLVSRCLLREA